MEDKNTIKQKLVMAMIAYQDKVTVFVKKTVANALLEALAIIFAELYKRLNQISKRLFTHSASGDYLDLHVKEWGFDRDKNVHASSIAVFYPVNTTVVSIAVDEITVSNGENFAAADTIILRKQFSVGDSAPEQEDATVLSKPSTNVIKLTAAPVMAVAQGDHVIQKITIGAGTRLVSDEGPVFETKTQVITGTQNAVLTGESLYFSVADKSYITCVDPGELGNVDIGSVNKLETTIDGVDQIKNVIPGSGGKDEEDDFEVRSKLFNRISICNKQTHSFFLAMCQEAHREVIRAYASYGDDVNGIDIYLVHRTGASFSALELAHIKGYIEDRLREHLTITCYNVTLTAVQITAEVSILQGHTLEEIYSSVASLYASFLDVRKWAWGEDVDDADLLSILNESAGVGNVNNFSPSADVSVGINSLPKFTSLKLTNINDSTQVLASDINQGY